MTHSGPVTPLEARASGPLAGKVRVPGDKSISHRSLILGALAVGETRISGLLEGEDVLNTAKSMRALGARVERTGAVRLEGQWRRCRRLCGTGRPARFWQFRHRLPPSDGRGRGLPGHGDVRRRRLAALAADAAHPRSAGADGRRAGEAREGGRLPLTCMARAIRCRSPTARRWPRRRSSPPCCSPGSPRPAITTVIESEASRDHTELMLKHFGADIVSAKEGSTAARFRLTGEPELHGAEVIVPADPSSAAFPVVAALIVPGSDVVLSDVMTNPLRTGLFTTLREMGASIEESEVAAMPASRWRELRVRASKLRGVEVPPERAPSMIDEYLVLAVAASFAEGTTVMRGLHELRVKESDRLAATADMLRVNGVKVEISGDDLIVEGRGHVPGGGLVATHMDHRIAMSALVMGCAADKPVKVDDTAFIATSFPGLHPDDALARRGVLLSARLRTARFRGSSRLRSRSATLPCRASASPRRSSRCRRHRMSS